MEQTSFDSLSAADPAPVDSEFRPLADRLRPPDVNNVVGQAHLLGPGKPLRRAIESGALHSMVLWGPPGTGKTTLARLVASGCDAELVTLSAVLSGVKEIRAVVEAARQRQLAQARRTVLFIDEVHRFNKSQQDSFLPHIEDGTITFVGATTENPSFELNNALLSRLRVYVLKSLTNTELRSIVDQGIEHLGLQMDETLRDRLALIADGDARRTLNYLELAAGLSDDGIISQELLEELVSGGAALRFDNRGDAFYDQISALHKCVRGSAPDAALYWFARMVSGGCDPLYIARRVVRIASEDIGNADPRALGLALDAWETFQRLGAPEGELAIAQAIVYLACAPKSNAVYTAFKAAHADVEQFGSLEVPDHLRNAPTRLAESLGHGKDYRYAHDEEHGYAAGENYFPKAMGRQTYYHPAAAGLEVRIREKLDHWRELDEQAAGHKD